MERRYGVPASTLLAVNGIKSGSSVTPGTRLVIPVYNANGASSSKTVRQTAVSSVSRHAKTDRTATASIQASKASQTTGKIASRTGSHSVPVAKARPGRLQKPSTTSQRESVAERRERLRAERKAKLATRDTEDLKQERARKLADRKAAALQARKDREDKKRQQLASKPRDRSNVRRVDGRKPDSSPQHEAARKNVDKAPVKTADTSSSSVDKAPVGSIEKSAVKNFRWPARGRIIQGFKKGNNDGINIAVPEGASIKAAEGGVVAYAGSELKGYGNLVLIRHPNGYVSAYAHNSALKVKRGDKVNRGQLIAKAGRTGNVSTPQLHFELRKGANPVNPVKLLGSN